MLAPKQRDEAQLEEGMGAGSGRFERLSALAGVLAVVLWAAGAAITGGDHIGLPGGLPEEGADETLAYFQENESTVVAASALFMVGSLSFLWFVGILRTRLAGAEGGVATFAAIAFAGGVATAIFALGMPTGGLVASLNADEIGASTAEALNAVETAFLIAAELSAIVMLVAAAVVSLQRGALPRWWAVVSIVLAVWLLILPIGWAGLLLGLPAWTVVTSVLLLRGSAVTPRI
jgi:hypothetical protein